MILRVAIVEDSLLVREGVRQVLERESDIQVVAACAAVDELLAGISESGPNVVVTDVRMPPDFSDEGIRLAVQLRQTHPEIGVVVLSQYAEPAYASALLGGGSAGRAYLLKERVSEPGQLAALHTYSPGAGSPRSSRPGQEQRECRSDAVPHRTHRRKTHQRLVHEAGAAGDAGRQPAGCSRSHASFRA